MWEGGECALAPHTGRQTSIGAVPGPPMILAYGTEGFWVLPHTPQRRESDTRLWLAVTTGLLHTRRSSLWSAQCSHCARGRRVGEGNALSGRKISWGKVRAVRVIFLMHHPVISVGPVPLQRWPGTFARLCSWLSAGPGISCAPYNTSKPPEWLGGQSWVLQQVREQAAVSCLQTGTSTKITPNSNSFWKQRI